MKKLFIISIVFAIFFILVNNVQASVTFSSITYDGTTADVGTTRTISITMRTSSSGETVTINSISISGGLIEVSTPATPFTVTYSGVSKDYVVRSDTAGTYTFSVTLIDTGGTSYTSSSNTLEYVDPSSFTLTVSENPSGTYSANGEFGVVANVYNSLSSSKTRNVTLWFDTSGFTVSGDPQSALVTLPASTTTQKIWNVTVGSSVSAGTRHAYIRLGDNTQAASYSFTVSSSGITTTAPSSGGGGGGISTGKLTKVKYTFKELKKNTIERWKVNQPGLGLIEMNMTVKNSANNVQITIERYDGRPSYIIHEIAGKIYQYIEINKTNLTDTDIDKIQLKINVNKSWILNNNIDESTVALNRYNNGVWEKLTTTKVEEDNSYVYYIAETTGLSVFAVTGELKAGATTVLTTIPATTGVTTTPVTTISGGLPSILPVGQVSTTTYALVIILIIVAVVTFWIYRRKA